MEKNTRITMKQYTNESQTAKLIELGLADSIREERYKRGSLPKNYSIGELIEMLPMTITHDIWWGGCDGKGGVWALQILTCGTEYSWEVSYVRNSSDDLYHEGRGELINVLYDMCVKLKEEGVI